jgi:hypothetical protein
MNKSQSCKIFYQDREKSVQQMRTVADNFEESLDGDLELDHELK